MTECIPFELSPGLMWLIGLGFFWLGICIIVAAQTLGKQVLMILVKAIQETMEQARKIQ